MSWELYLGGLVFFTVLMGVFYAVAWSVLLQIRENYLRYFQKADLQWTGSDSRFPRFRLPLWRILLAAAASSWVLVEVIRRL
ncbi:MAG: hypothetical protein Kow001_10580 [Acidobacteriota bacterium]